MEDKHFHKQFNEGDELPVNIPSTDYAWDDMRSKLDTSMPESAGITGDEPASKSTAGKNLKWMGGLSLFLFISWFIISQVQKNNQSTTAKNTTTTEQAVVTAGDKPVNDTAAQAAQTDNVNSNTEDKITGTVTPGKEEQPKEKDAVVNSNGQSSASEPVAGNEAKRNNNKPAIVTGKKQPGVTNTITGKQVRQANPGKGLTPQFNAGNLNVVKGKSQQQQKNNAGKNPNEKNISGINRPASKAGKEKSNNDTVMSSTDIGDDDSTTAIINESAADTAEAAGLPAATKDTLQQSALKEPAPKKTTRAFPFKIQGGLQWNLQAPQGSAGNYFIGTKGERDPLRSFYPGAWLSIQRNKSLITLEVSPFFSTAVPAKPYSTDSINYRIRDTLFTDTEIKTLQKLFGMSAALGYSGNISSNWWVGGSLRGNWWKKGVAVAQTELLKRADTSNFDDIRITNSSTYLLSDTAWATFSKMQFVVNAEVWYKQKLWQAGLQVGVPMAPLTKREGPRRPIYAALVFRLAIPTGGKRK